MCQARRLLVQNLARVDPVGAIQHTREVDVDIFTCLHRGHACS